MSFKIGVSGPVALLLLTGCDTLNPHNIASPDQAFGESVKYNAEIQVVDPDPVYGADAARPGDSGALGAAAVRRYRSGQVKAVEMTGTRSGSGGSQGSQGPQ